MFNFFLVLSIVLSFSSNVYPQVIWNTPIIPGTEKGKKVDVSGTISSIKWVQVTWLSNQTQRMAEARREVKLREFPGNSYHLMDDTVIKASCPIEIGTKVEITSNQETNYHDLVKGNAKYFAVLSIQAAENKQTQAKTREDPKTITQNIPNYTAPAEGKTSPTDRLPLTLQAWSAKVQKSNLTLSEVGEDTLITVMLESPSNPKIMPSSIPGKSQLLLEFPQGKTTPLPTHIKGNNKLIREILTEPIYPGGGVRIILDLLPDAHFIYWRVSRPVFSGKTIFVLGLKPETRLLADQASGTRKKDIGTRLSQKNEHKIESGKSPVKAMGFNTERQSERENNVTEKKAISPESKEDSSKSETVTGTVKVVGLTQPLISFSIHELPSKNFWVDPRLAILFGLLQDQGSGIYVPTNKKGLKVKFTFKEVDGKNIVTSIGRN
jgi:hypothetical protein